MWNVEKEVSPNVIKFRLLEKDRPLPFANVLNLWQHDAAFRSFFLAQLKTIPFAAYRWEMPPITTVTRNRPFECVFLNAPGLAPTPERDAFAEHFPKAVDTIVVFPNLGGDTTLIVPCPLSPSSAYNHLAAFLARAPVEQQHRLLERIGVTMSAAISAQPRWLSTAGAGVYWLHVRIDSRPKYYGHAPYRVLP